MGQKLNRSSSFQQQKKTNPHPQINTIHSDVFNAIQDGITVLDKNFNIIEVNEWIIEKFGKGQNLVGEKCYAVYKNRETPCKGCPTNVAFKTGHPAKETFVVNDKNNSKLCIEENAYPVKNEEGEVVQVIEHIKDITEVQESKLALIESESKFRALFEKGPIGVAYHKMIYDSTGKPIDYLFLDANETYEELTGIDPRGKLVTEAFPGIENDTSDWIGAFGKVALTGETTRFESYLEANQRWYDCVGYQYKPDHFVAAFLEITKRKKAEIQLQEINENLIQKNEVIRLNSERLESLLKITQFQTQSIQELLDFALEEAIKLTNSKIGYIYFYQEHTRQFILNTWSKGVMNECSVMNQQTVYDLDKTGCWGEAVRQRKPIIINNYQEVNPIKKGTPEGHVQLLKFLTIPVIIEGKIVAVAGVANKNTDYDDADIRQLTLLMDNVWKISERLELINNLERAKEKAEESENKLIEAQKLSHVGSWEYYVDTDSIKWSKELFNIFERSYDLPAPKYSEQRPFYTEESFARLDKAVQDCIRHEIPYEIELDITTTSGAVKQIISKGNVIKDTNNKIVGCYGTAQDITERKIIERELIKAKEKAQESDRLKSAFLANMSHEIRTPMNGILGFTDLLQRPGLTGEQQKEFISIIQKSGKRLINTVTDLIDISKIEAGLVEVTKNELNVNEELQSLFSFFSPEAGQKGLEISLEQLLPENRKTILIDKTKFHSILSNLIKNAIKYTQNGSVKFGGRLNNYEFEFYVKDTGMGIPKHRQQAIFDRFVQADIADKRALEGSGLGLSIVKAYVEMLNGKIWLESEEGVGSTFYFTLPAEGSIPEKTEKKVMPVGEKLDTANKKLKILIVEDDETSYLYLSIVLKNMAVEILRAVTGEKAVALAHSNPDIDVILMDIRIPGMDGFEATRKIREFNNEVIIIAQTAFALSGDGEKTLAAGCDDYMAKPIKTDLLLEKIVKNRKEKEWTN